MHFSFVFTIRKNQGGRGEGTWRWQKCWENLKVKSRVFTLRVKKTVNALDDGCKRLPRDPSFPLPFPLSQRYLYE